MNRCSWVGNNPVYINYHDNEWGVPVHDDSLLFEFLILEGAQAGLSWITILKKRDNYRQAFDNFDAEKIASYTEKKIEELIMNSGIIRNRLKIMSVITNARVFLDVKAQYGSFDKYIWKFAPYKRNGGWANIKDVPCRTNESNIMSMDLKKRGFKFVGSTICYSFMQAVGMVNDHTIDCFKYEIIS